MKHLLLPIAGVLSLALTTSCSRADQVSAVVRDKPTIEAAVAFDNAPETAGWQWRWNEDNGRRDVGQTFTATRDFSLDKILLRIESGAHPTISGAPYTLSIFEFPDTRSLVPGQSLATHEGTLPDNATGQIYRSGQWLEFDIPDVAVKNGRTYGFLLRFKNAKPANQGVVLTLASKGGYPGGQSVFSTDGAVWKAQGDFYFLLMASGAQSTPVAATPSTPAAPVVGKTILVDRNNGPIKTLAAATAQAKPGDTIKLAPNSGPYREELFVKTSGEAHAPITIDGGGNLITGFEPLTNWQQQNGLWTCKLPGAFPRVITYNGERLIQDATTNQFTKYATLSDDQTTLTLKADAKPQGWEISSRAFAVKVLNTSFHTYKNLRASGSQNDGFNLHGKGEGLVFENIEAFQNLDEGFSSHDDMVSVVRGGKFWSNDNGVGNIARSKTTLENVDVYDNLGFGVWLQACSGTLKNVRAWNNGIVQVFLLDSDILAENVRGYTPTFKARPWLSYMESKKSGFGRPVIVKESTLAGHEVVVETANQP